MFYIGMIVLAIIIILIFIFGEVISGVPNTKSSEKPTNKKLREENLQKNCKGKVVVLLNLNMEEKLIY